MLMASTAHAPFYLDSHFWVAVPLVLFFVLIISKGVHKSIFGALDARAEGIKTELEEARALREEAQALLASYHRKQKEAETLAEDIIAQARKDAEIMAATSRKELSERLERRTQQAEDKIANAEAQAMADVRSAAADLAASAAEQVLRTSLKTADHSKLVAEGIKQMGSVLN